MNCIHMTDSQPGAGQGHPAEMKAPCVVSVGEGYTRWASTYDKGPNPLLAREERYLEPILANVQVHRILDLACGTGRWMKKIARDRGRLSVGIDSSVAMLKVAATKNESRDFIARALCENLPFAGGAFDLAICSFALGHIADLRPMASELSRVLHQDADVFVSDLHPDAYKHGWRVGFRDEDGPAEIELQPRSQEEVAELFYGSGFGCMSQTPLWLEEEEKPIFDQAGKMDSFTHASSVPAILVWHFRRSDSA